MAANNEFDQFLSERKPATESLEPICPAFKGTKISVLIKRTERMIMRQAKRFQDADEYVAWAVGTWNDVVNKLGGELEFVSTNTKGQVPRKRVQRPPKRAPVKKTAKKTARRKPGPKPAPQDPPPETPATPQKPAARKPAPKPAAAKGGRRPAPKRSPKPKPAPEQMDLQTNTEPAS